MKQLIFNNQQKSKKKGKKRKGGKGKGNEKGKRIWVLLKDFWQKIETMYISKKNYNSSFKKTNKEKPLTVVYCNLAMLQPPSFKVKNNLL